MIPVFLLGSPPVAADRYSSSREITRQYPTCLSRTGKHHSQTPLASRCSHFDEWLSEQRRTAQTETDGLGVVHPNEHPFIRLPWLSDSGQSWAMTDGNYAQDIGVDHGQRRLSACGGQRDRHLSSTIAYETEHEDMRSSIPHTNARIAQIGICKCATWPLNHKVRRDHHEL